MTKINETKELKAEFIAREIDFPDIAKTITDKIISERSKSYACNSVWASEVAHDCERYLVYQQCDWEKAKPIDDYLLLVFNEGNIQEDQLLFELQKAHIKIKDLQIGIKVSEANISGKLDCVVMAENNKEETCYLPCEIKSMSDNVFRSVNTVADFEKYAWTRKYYGQMQIYLKNDSGFFPYGYFLAKNKQTGMIKLIKDYDGSNAIKFNQEYWDGLIARAKRVNKYVLNNKKLQLEIASTDDEQEKEDLIAQYSYPDRIKYDLKVCKGCKFEHICISELSDVIGNTIENESVIGAVDEYVEALDDRNTYKVAEKRYDNALACLKSVFPLKDMLYMTDKHVIETKIRKGGKSEYLTFNINSLDESETTTGAE